MKRMGMIIQVCFLVAGLSVVSAHGADTTEHGASHVYAKDNLVAWCVVPFDAKKRGPEARAKLIKSLGIGRVAYDWRAEHVSSFEDEIVAYQKNGLEYFAFWGWHEDMRPLIEKYAIKPQLWKTVPSPKKGTQAQKVEAAGKQLLELAKVADELGCKLGLYNHGGWGGEPANMIAVCKWLRRETGGDHVGIVYNFHHGHGHVQGFAKSFAKMQPYLLCVNINGMADEADVDGLTNKILPIGSGKHEDRMMRVVSDSGYQGPIGILGHRYDEDLEVVLRGNLKGFEGFLKDAGDEATLKTYKGDAVKGKWVVADDHETMAFKTSKLKGVFVGREQRAEFKGSGHGLRELVYGPTGRDLHPAAGDVASHRRHRGSMNLYRVYSKTETFGALRDDVATVRRLKNGAELKWLADEKRPVDVKATWRVTGPAQVDLVLEARPSRDIEKFEILLANYVPYDMVKGVYVERGGGGGRVEGLEVRPGAQYGGEKDYPFFPMNAAARKNQAQTGRIHSSWTWGTVVTKANAALAMTYATDGETQILLMGDPESTSAVCATPKPVSGEAEDWTSVEKHSAQYLSFFCRDVKAGEKLVARARVVFMEAKTGFEGRHQRLYEEFVEGD